MGDPGFTAADLGTYLNDDSINEPRADMIIGQAQDACESVVNPVPASKMFVVFRVAIRAYISTGGQARGYQLGQADSEYSGSSPVSGVYLTKWDRDDLLSDGEQSAPAAFTIQLNPYGQAGVSDSWPGPYGWPYW